MNKGVCREIITTDCKYRHITFTTIITRPKRPWPTEHTKYRSYRLKDIKHAWKQIYKQIKAGKKCIRTTFAEHLINPILCYIATDRCKYETIWLTHLALASIPKDVRKLIIRRIVRNWPLIRFDVVIPTYEIEWKTVEFGMNNTKKRQNMVCVRIK